VGVSTAPWSLVSTRSVDGRRSVWSAVTLMVTSAGGGDGGERHGHALEPVDEVRP
jgi:glucose-6-phosphate isomerase